MRAPRRQHGFFDWLYTQATPLLASIATAFFFVGVPPYAVLYLMCVTLALLVHHMAERCRDLERICNAAELALCMHDLPTGAPRELSDVSRAARPSPAPVPALNDSDPQEGVARLCFEMIGRDVCCILFSGEVDDAAVQREDDCESSVHDKVLHDAHAAPAAPPPINTGEAWGASSPPQSAGGSDGGPP